MAAKSNQRSILALLKIPGKHQGCGDLEHFGRLDPDEAEIEPAPRALGDIAKQRDRDQQRHPTDKERHRKPDQPASWHQRSHPERKAGDREVTQMRLEAAGEIIGG